MSRLISLVAVLLVCVACAKGTPTNPEFPPGVSPTPLPQPSYVGIGRYQKLGETTLAPTFGGVVFMTFVEVRQRSGTAIRHDDVPGFVYAVQGPHTLSRDDGERASTFEEQSVGWAGAGVQHVNPTAKDEVWYFLSLRSILDRGAKLTYPSYRVLFESGDLPPVTGKPLVHQVGLITMDVDGRTSSHSHGGTEAFYVMKGSVELAQNDGSRIAVSSGHGAFVKPGAVMQLRVVGNDPVEILTYFVTPEGAPWQTNLQTLP